jgi:hypothetical protein
MSATIRVEGYQNYRGELRVGMRFIAGGGYDRVLTRAETEALIAALTLALTTEAELGDDTECHDCGSTLHRSGTYHCPAVHQGDTGE